MAVSIRLQRKGSTHKPFYHIVAADRRSPRDGRFIEKLGYYDSKTEPSVIEIKSERLQHWYQQGAQVSSAVEKLAAIKKITLQRTTTAPASK